MKREKIVMDPITFYLGLIEFLKDEKNRPLAFAEKMVIWVTSPICFILLFTYSLLIGVNRDV